MDYSELIPVLVLFIVLVTMFGFVWPKIVENGSGWKLITSSFKTDARPSGIEITDFFGRAFLASDRSSELLYKGPWPVRIWVSEAGIYVSRPQYMFWAKSAFIRWEALSHGMNKRFFGKKMTLEILGVKEAWLEMSKARYARLLDAAPVSALQPRFMEPVNPS
jgi:hypothetical protein